MVFSVLILYSYAKVFVIPYLGFDINPSDWSVIGVWAEDQADHALQVGDHILQIGKVDLETYRRDVRQPLIEGGRPGDIIPLRVRRGDQELTIPWELPAGSTNEILDRLNTIWLPYIYWIAGTGTFFLVRPRDWRWRLLTASYYLTALWLMAGLLSAWATWESSILLRVLVWFCVPVYLHLHWVFPRPLGRLPGPVIWGAYLGAAGFAVLEWFQIVPPSTFFLGFILAVGGSLLLLLIHAFLQPDQRRDLKLLGAVALFIVLPTIVVGAFAANQMEVPLWYGWGALLSLPAIPGAYFYVIYRRQMGRMELRANRFITLYIFLALLFVVAVPVVYTVNTFIEAPGTRTSLGVAGVLLGGMGIVVFYPNFARLIERRFLGIPLPPTHLLETYAARITTSLDTASLSSLLREEVLPGLMIRQSALLRIGGNGSLLPLYTEGIAPEDLPDASEIPGLVERSGQFLFPIEEGGSVSRLWIRVVLPLEVGGNLVCVWLLGRKDPDDYYSQAEITELKAIANQTAIALVNISHAERLRALYQANIERQEQERTRLARALHDDVLNQLTALMMSQDDLDRSPEYRAHFDLITSYLYDVISDLRPAMLIYGLRLALEEYIDHLARRAPDGMEIVLNISEADVRYSPKVEEHLFRIVQQACENALRHANARSIQVHGTLESRGLSLSVEDDGKGFQYVGALDLNDLLRQGHYGLVGMHERAALIDAALEIESTPGRGTRVRVTWEGTANPG
jgi:signal transduction histidine kinase